MLSERGVLYVATGERFVQEAIASARSLRKHSPQVRIGIVTDIEQPGSEFDDVLRLASPTRSLRDKVLGLSLTPYSRTLYVDADTVFLAPIEPIFELLDRFELAAAYENGRYHPPLPPGNEMPQLFPQYNTGVLAYRLTQRVQELFDDCAERYAQFQLLGQAHKGDASLGVSDQPVFRSAIWHSRVQTCALPFECNAILANVSEPLGNLLIAHQADRRRDPARFRLLLGCRSHGLRLLAIAILSLRHGDWAPAPVVAGKCVCRRLIEAVRRILADYVMRGR